MTDLGTLGSNLSKATALNSRGQVVGVSITGAGEQHPFLWTDGVLTDLGTGRLVQYRGGPERRRPDRGSRDHGRRSGLARDPVAAAAGTGAAAPSAGYGDGSLM